MIPMVSKTPHSLKKEEKLTNYFHKANISTLIPKYNKDYKNKEKKGLSHS